MASFDERFGAIIRRDGIVAFPVAILRYFQPLGLTPQEVWLLLELLSHRWTSLAPYPSLARLARERGVPRRTIQTYLKGLRDKSLVTISERSRADGGRTSSEYYLEPLFDRLEQLIRADEQTTPPVEIPTSLHEGRGCAHAAPASHAGGPTEQALLTAPGNGKLKGTPGHVDPSGEDPREEEEVLTDEEARNGVGPYQALIGPYCTHFHLVPVRESDRLIATFQTFAGARALPPERVGRLALQALDSTPRVAGEPFFWQLLERLYPIPPKEATE